MSKFVGGLVAGGLLVALGVSLGKSSGYRPRHHRRRHRFVRGRSGFNPQGARLQREMRLYLREARELIRELRTPKIDAEFIEPPNPANASPAPEPSAPEATKE